MYCSMYYAHIRYYNCLARKRNLLINKTVLFSQSKRGSVEEKANTVGHQGRNSPAPRRTSETLPTPVRHHRHHISCHELLFNESHVMNFFFNGVVCNTVLGVTHYK